MSREVRRVAIDYKHPIVTNPHWLFQSAMRARRGGPHSRLHEPGVMFKPLYAGPHSAKLAEWDRGRAEWDAGTHEHLSFLLRYHSPDGWLNNDGTRDNPVPLTVYGPDAESIEREFFPANVSEIQDAVPYEDDAGMRPTSEDYMPDFDEPEDALGWCLYETVSEGTPVTPVFATANDLVEHLCSIGQDWDQGPMRRASAESIVRIGFTMGSMVVVAGVVYRSDVDADKLKTLWADGAAPSC